MKNNKKRRISKVKVRLFIMTLIFTLFVFGLGYNCFNNINKIRELKNEKKELNDKISILINEKEILDSDIQRLKDPEYIAKYVREKYYFSKDGELILKLD